MGNRESAEIRMKTATKQNNNKNRKTTKKRKRIAYFTFIAANAFQLLHKHHTCFIDVNCWSVLIEQNLKIFSIPVPINATLLAEHFALLCNVYTFDESGSAIWINKKSNKCFKYFRKCYCRQVGVMSIFFKFLLVQGKGWSSICFHGTTYKRYWFLLLLENPKSE